MVNDKDPYKQVASGKLKLKGDGIKKKHKKNKNKFREQVVKTIGTENENECKNVKPVDRRTKAEIAYKNMQEKMVSYVFPGTKCSLLVIKICCFFASKLCELCLDA